MTTDNRYANKYKYNVDGMNVLTKDRSSNKKNQVCVDERCKAVQVKEMCKFK